MSDPVPRVEGVVVALGDRPAVGALALAGVDVRVAASPDEVRAAWEALGPEVGLVVLAPAAASALGARVDDLGSPLTVVMPP
ncbi:hypothetical protein [Demequina maris]|uniref:hypothetical protein n=1 Tax=Demequina maris TaxID=1638982 RepID=UPI00078174D0|nr:hypothetical protein [Demequina maris]